MSDRPQPASRASTIRDVARHAGVGVGTVSRVLNDQGSVSAAARHRVVTAIAELGYRPSVSARRLSRGRTDTIGVIAPFFTTPSVGERLRGVTDRLHREGEYDLLLLNVETLHHRMHAFGKFASADRIDGLLIVSLSPTADEASTLRAEQLPTALVDAARRGFPSVTIDDTLGGEMAAQHLLDRGHTAIGFVGDAASPLRFTSSERRRAGIHRAMQKAGIEPQPQLERLGMYGRTAARQLALELLQLPHPPTAIAAASDMQAVGVLEAARELRLRVPEELAVTGFDDIEVAEALGLTTVRQPLYQSGVRGVELLLGAIDGHDGRGAINLSELELVVRSST